jgi:hypothetical protein
MPHQTHERRDDGTRTDRPPRTKRDDRLNDRRTHAKHPDDDRLTPADLHRNGREPGSRHAQMLRRR